jgi:hypothetical protein
MIRRTTFTVIAMSATAFVAGLLYCFDPATVDFFPTCFWKRATGWDCPGCGSTRAAHRLLHGNFVEAFRLNPLFVAGLPAGLAAWIAARWTRLQPQTERDRRRTRRFAWCLAAVAVSFGVWRNL